jgi:hypothetical protein
MKLCDIRGYHKINIMSKIFLSVTKGSLADLYMKKGSLADLYMLMKSHVLT